MKYKYLRPTRESDIDYVLNLEQNPENAEHVDQWSRSHHISSLSNPDFGHHIIKSESGERLGYLITRELAPSRCLKIQRIVVESKGRGTGSAALREIANVASNRSDIVHLILYVRGGDIGLIKFYRTLGFDISNDEQLDRPGYTLLTMDV